MSELTIDYILNLNPCNDGAKWLRTQPDIAIAWDICQRSDWMLWLCKEAELLNTQQDLALQLAMLDTPLSDGRCVLDLITDQRSLAFIQMKHQQLAGEVISNAAWDAAKAAAWDAVRATAKDAARATARNTARAIARATARATAKDAAWAAAWAAANTAGDTAGAAAWAASWDAANTAALAWQADRIREIVGNPFSPQNDRYQ